jgi:hypothetical protein
MKWSAWQSAGFAAAVLAGFCQPAAAQTATLTSSGVATGAISCAPSANGTGHMVCLEYSTSGSLIGLSWQAPPTTGFKAAPVAATQTAPAIIAGEGTEIVGTIDVDNALPAPGGTPVGTPGCAPEDNDTGTTACLVVIKTTSGSFAIQGITFYPPTDDAATTTPSGLVTLATEPANSVIGTPGCTETDQPVTGNGTTGRAVVCAITIDGQLFGVGFEPKTGVVSPLTSLLSGASVTGNPSCTSDGAQFPSVCAVREGNSLEGFALAFTPPPSGSTTASIAGEDAILVGSMSFAGDPSCTVPENGQVGTTSFVTTCGIVSGTTLFGVSFDPINALSSSSSSQTTAFQSLGAAPDTGSWTGSIGCSTFPDFRFEQEQENGTPVNVNVSPNQNLVGCAAISSTHNVFEVTFDPRSPVSRSVTGPFGGNANANLSCLALAIDADRIYCGATTTAGGSGGYLFPVGVVPTGTASIFLQFLSN